MRFIPFFMFLFLAPTFSKAVAFEYEGVADAVLQHEVRIKGAAPSHATRLLVFVDVQGRSANLDASTLAEFVRARLWKNGIDSKIYRGNLARNLVKGWMSREDLFSPKLIVEIATSAEGSIDQYSVSGRVTYLEYKPKADSTERYRAISEWERDRKFAKVSGSEIESTIGSFLEKETSAFAKSHRELGRRRRSTGPSGGVAMQSTSAKENQAELSYSVQWNDPNNRRGRLFVGATLGTPALFNLNAGYWGSRSFPVVAGISGMYFGLERRGLQTDVGWAFDNSGRLRQAASVALTLFNGADQTTTEERDRFGRVTRTTIDTVNSLHPYVGPLYTVEWNDFRAHAGAAFRVDEANSQPLVRFLIQVGYTPRLGL